MHPLLKPRWIFITATLPQLILFFLYYSSYQVIGTLLEEDTLSHWKGYGITLGTLLLLSTAYGVYAGIKKKPVHWLAAGAMLLAYLALYIYFLFNMEQIVPWSIPRWMIFEGDLQLYALTFLMPVLIYSLIALVVWLTPAGKRHRAWISFVIAVSIPLAWYLAINIITTTRSNFYESSALIEHMLVIAFASGTVLFLFFLIRGVYIVVTNNSKGLKKYQLAWKIPVALVFPLLGLAINNGWFTMRDLRGAEGIFGDFTSLWFLILAIINGIAVCLPDFKDPQARLAAFLLRCITYPFTVYFFIVFLPWLPLSIIAIIAIGAGFLMLTPLVLMVVHTNEIASDRKYLKAAYPRSRMWLAMLICFLVIPSFIIGSYISDRRNLHAALDHVYSPDLGKPAPSIDIESISGTLKTIRQNRSSSRGFLIDERNTPYLSALYRWIVLDNMTLSNKKMALLETAFKGSSNDYEDNSWMWSWRTLPDFEPLVKIDSINTVTKYDEKEQAWRTQVDLAITNYSERDLQEYSTELKLPDGCWISDYYLVVEGKKKKGLLVEKQAAMWVYQQIVSTNRDPGILYYRGANRVAFKVFPFNTIETRYTGIEFLHKEPVVLGIDSFRVALGDTTRPAKHPVVVTAGKANAVYVPAIVKASLPKVNRKPYYHFIFDASAGTDSLRGEMMKKVDQLLERNLISEGKGEISFVNYKITTVPLADRASAMQSVKAEGGFLAELAMRKELYDHYKRNDNTYPVFVLVTDDIERALFTGDIRDMLFTYPEGDVFYWLHPSGVIGAYPFSSPRSMVSAKVDTFPSPQVIHYSNGGITAWLPNNGEGSFVAPLADGLNSEALEEDSWTSAAKMQMIVQHNALHPYQAEDHWLSGIQNSFRTGIMTPSTSYIVVENEAQEKAMLEKQKQILSGKRGLDADNDIHQMSEPSLWLMLIAAAGAVWLARRQKRARQHSDKHHVKS